MSSTSDKLRLWISMRLGVSLCLTTCLQACKHGSQESSGTTARLLVWIIKWGGGVVTLPLTFLLIGSGLTKVDGGRVRFQMAIVASDPVTSLPLLYSRKRNRNLPEQTTSVSSLKRDLCWSNFSALLLIFSSVPGPRCDRYVETLAQPPVQLVCVNISR